MKKEGELTRNGKFQYLLKAPRLKVVSATAHKNIHMIFKNRREYTTPKLVFPLNIHMSHLIPWTERPKRIYTHSNV
jgi:hypothetical protein